MSSAFCTSAPELGSVMTGDKLSARSPSVPLLWPQFSHPPLRPLSSRWRSSVPSPPVSTLSHTCSSFQAHGLESRALASASVSASVHSPTHQMKGGGGRGGCVLTFCLQLDEVAQGERHGLRVHCVQDLGRRRTGQRDALLLDVIGHLHRIPGARHPADAHHLIGNRREEQGGTVKPTVCVWVRLRGGERMDGGKQFLNISFHLQACSDKQVSNKALIMKG